MSGSIKWMVYLDDVGISHAVKVDESNGILGGFTDLTDALAGTSTLDRGIEMRGVNLISATGQRRFLKIGVPTSGLITGAITSVTIDSVEYQVTSVRGEKRVKPFAFDTGLNDGTAS